MRTAQGPLVSIIIPVYNAQCFVERCLVSCRTQTYRNIEVIMVNDGSTDHSEKICRKYAGADRRFRLACKKNSGPSRARNTGIRLSRGKYIMFADSDDWLAGDAVETFVGRAEEDGSDIVVSGFNRIINSIKIPMCNIRKNTVITREAYAENMAESPADFYYGVMWNKCYRSSIIKKHHIYCSPRFKWCEDFLFNLEYLKYTATVSTVSAHLYYYVKRADSICESQIRFARMIALKYELLSYYRNLYKSLNLYDANKLKINTFLFSYAHDTGEVEYRKARSLQKSGAKKTAGKAAARKSARRKTAERDALSAERGSGKSRP